MSHEKYFFLNGDRYFTKAEFTLLDLLNYLNSNLSLLVIEHNCVICPPKNWEKIWIQENDSIEIVTIVGGG